MQNAYYEGYTGNVEVTNLFVFNFLGEVIHAAVKPGSWHDSRMVNASSLLHTFLQDNKTQTGYAVLCDSAFTVDLKATKGKVVRGRKSNETLEMPLSEEMYAIDRILQRAIPS